MTTPTYSHTQQAPLCLIFFGSAIWLFVLGQDSVKGALDNVFRSVWI
jgi:hypothetical protein